MKNLFAVLLLVVFSCSFAFAAETEVSYEVNGQKVLGTLSMPEKEVKFPLYFFCMASRQQGMNRNQRLFLKVFSAVWLTNSQGRE